MSQDNNIPTELSESENKEINDMNTPENMNSPVPKLSIQEKPKSSKKQNPK